MPGTLDRPREDDAAHDPGVCNRALKHNGNDVNDERLEIFRRREAEIEAQYGRPRSLRIAKHCTCCGSGAALRAFEQVHILK